MTWFSEITDWAKTLDSKWIEAKNSGIEFSDFAFKEMLGHSFHKNFNLSEDVKEILEASQYPEQMRPESKFGDPPITLYISADRSFYLDIYIWEENQTSIHQHSFEGAFSVLTGHSIESVYEFDREVSCGPSFWGQLHKKKLLKIVAGDVQPIYLNSRMIHRVLHIAKPTVSLVLRTNQSTSFEIQYNYNFNKLASNGHLPPEIIGKLRAFTWFLKTGNTPTFAMVETLIPYAQFWTLLAAYPQAFTLLKKLSFIHSEIELCEEIVKENFFIGIFQSLATEENKVLLAAMEFFGESWSDWVKTNYSFNISDSREKLKLALTAMPWVDEKTKNYSLVKELFSEPNLIT